METSSSSAVDDASGTASGRKGYTARAEVSAAAFAQEGGASPSVEATSKNFTSLSIIGLAYAILNSWTAMAASLSVALPSGGPSAVIWGIIPSTIGNLAMALSLAEICHVYPTSGGQYHWSCILASAESAPLISWITGWFCVAGWWALTATAGSLTGSLITGMISLGHPEYEYQRYQIFLIYIGITLGAMAINIWGLRVLPLVNKMAFVWSIAGATTICVVCLACRSGSYQPASFVFGTYINETGWSDGIAWILGLLQSAFGLTGYDAVSHMVEEMPLPHINAPRAMVLSVLIGAGSSFIFLVVLLFCITDVNGVISTPAGALLGAMYQATDLGSSSALNAILSSSVVFMQFSYSMPVGLLLFRGRHLLRPPSFPEPTMTLGPIFGPICNVVGLCFTALTTVFFLFPPGLPVDANSMNYAVVVFGIIFIVATLTWTFQGRHHFRGPRDLGGLLELARSEFRVGTEKKDVESSSDPVVGEKDDRSTE